MTATPSELEAVLRAAAYLLGARQDRMLGLEQWIDLARAVAPCHGVKTADLLTERDLEDAAEDEIEWDDTVDGPLPHVEGQ